MRKIKESAMQRSRTSACWPHIVNHEKDIHGTKVHAIDIVMHTAWAKSVEIERLYSPISNYEVSSGHGDLFKTTMSFHHHKDSARIITRAFRVFSREDYRQSALSIASSQHTEVLCMNAYIRIIIVRLNVTCPDPH